MAFPTIHGAVTTDTVLTTTPSVNLPTGMVNGSLVVLFVDNGYQQAPTADLSAWTLLSSILSTGWRGIYAKIVDGTEATTLALGTMTSTRVASVAFEVRGWYGSGIATAFECATPYTLLGTDAPPFANPALNPANWDVEDTLWLTAYMCDAVNVLTTAPSGFTEVGSVWTTQSGSGCVSVYYRNEAVASKTPGNWTVTNQRVGATYTLAIRPSGVATVTKLKLLAEAAAQGAQTVAGIVFEAPTGSDITGPKLGEFTNAYFEASLEGGNAVLKVACSQFGGGALTTSDTPVALVRTSTYTTGIVDCTVIEE